MKTFATEEDIKSYIENGINNIQNINEYRLYRKEQYQLTDDVIFARNCIEWLIRINKIITNIKYSLEQSYIYASKMSSTTEETKNSQLYSYYLEDAVYRDIVLWDMLKQFLNEYYKCGYAVENELSIYKFLKNNTVRNKIGTDSCKEIKDYLESEDHKKVRNDLRNSFTHSLDNTSIYLFHRVNQNGLLQADLSRAFPEHPFNNLVLVLDDITKYLFFLEKYRKNFEEFIKDNVILVTVGLNMHCQCLNDERNWSISILKEHAEQIMIQCDHPCEHSFMLDEVVACKPKSIDYYRINETNAEPLGHIDLKMTISEMEEKYGKGFNKLE